MRLESGFDLSIDVLILTLRNHPLSSTRTEHINLDATTSICPPCASYVSTIEGLNRFDVSTRKETMNLDFYVTQWWHVRSLKQGCESAGGRASQLPSRSALQRSPTQVACHK